MKIALLRRKRCVKALQKCVNVVVLRRLVLEGGCGRWSDFRCVPGGAFLDNRNSSAHIRRKSESGKSGHRTRRVARAENFLYTKYTRGYVTKNSQSDRLTKPPPGGIIIATGNESLAISQEYKIINNNPVRKRYCYV